jgi:hypothetical protein
MTAVRLTQAGETSAMLQHATRRGLRVMIPGAWEGRDQGPIVPATEISVPALSPHAGSALSHRRTLHRNVLSRLWHYVMRPTDSPPF